jgi:ABC-2 type transport system ATP-binding protein
VSADAVECDNLRYSFRQSGAIASRRRGAIASRRRSDTVGVDGVSLSVRRGEIFGMLGPNGAGKTTTIRAITALLPVPPGTISVFGLDVARHRMAVRRLIGYVPQMLSAEGALSGRENVSLFARLFDLPRRERATRVDEAITLMGLTDAADRPVKTYSGGMIRRLELAQALVSSPRLLILDEPTAGLDPVARAGVWDRIAEVREKTNMTVLITTHYMDEAEQSCDRVALMHRGKVRAIDTPEALIASLGVEGATLDDVFRTYTGDDWKAAGEDQAGGLRNVRGARRTARRVG